MVDGPATHDASNSVSTIVRSFASASHRRGFQTAVEAVLAGHSGICVTGEQGTGRTAFLNGLAAVLPADRVLVARLDPVARSPDDLAQLLEQTQRRRGGAGGVLLIVPDADVLRRDTLDRLDEIAGKLLADAQGLQLLLAGRPTLLNRLRVNQHRRLEAYMAVKVTLPLLTPPESAAYLTRQLAMMAPATTLSQAQVQAVLKSSEGNPRLIRDALAEQLRPQDAPRHASTRPVLPPWVRRPFTAVAALVLLAGVTTGALRVVLRHGPGHSPTPPALSPAEIDPAAPPDQDATHGDASPGNTLTHGDASPGNTLTNDDASPGDTLTKAPPANTAPSRKPGRTEQAFAMPLTLPRLERPEGAGQGLLLIARRGDTLKTLYRRIYAGITPPSYEAMLAANPEPIRPGARVMLPTPPYGWEQEPVGRFERSRR